MTYKRRCEYRERTSPEFKQAKKGSGHRKDLSASVSRALDLAGPRAIESDLMALEPRILLDAAGAATGAEIADDVAQLQADSWQPSGDAVSEASLRALFPEHGDGASVTTATSELAFVDATLEGADTLIASISSNVEIIYLDADRDGVEQIAETVQGRTGIDAIHIISHGRSGTLDLGSTKMTTASIAGKHADEMAIIRDALAADADILIYGCDFAAGTRGANAVSALAAATGADVAASTDDTGAVALGGDWDLETETGLVETAAIVAEDWANLLASGGGADDDGGGSGIAVTGNVTTNIDVLANDTVTGVATLTQIIDPSDPANPLALAVGVPVQLTTNTTIELLADGTLDVTTSALGQGLETFDYVFTDAGSGGQATLTLDRTQGSLINVPATASGTEDNNVPLGITIDPALTSGGSQLDLIATENGFRDASAGATPTDFTIPPRTTAVRITGFGGEDNGANQGIQEHRQTFTVTVDLAAGTYSGHILHVVANGTNGNDSYAFSGVALGDDSTSGTVTGAQNHNVLTVSLSGDTLSVVESQSLIDQAYLVEYLTADGTSSDYLGSSGAILDSGTTAAETTATIATVANANFLVINIQDGRGSNNAEQEDNGGGRIVIDLDTGLASGVLYGQTGRGGNQNTAYSFTDYDITSGAFIVDPATRNATVAGGATVIGDTAANSLIRLPNYIISMSGNDLVLERSSDYAGFFEELISVQSYERYDVGSSAQSLGSDAVVATYSDDQSLATWDLDIAGGAETGNITLTATALGGSASGGHDHGATARIFVDLVNGTTSGSFFLIRADNPDLIVWTDVPFGQRLTDAIGTNAEANFNNLNQTTIDMVGALRFNLITNPDGSQTLQVTARSNGNNDSGQDWSTVMQAQWSGREPVTISGYPNGGTFSAGAFNPTTGEWEVEAENITGMEFVPPEHFSGQTTTMLVDYNGDTHNIALNISRVADAPTIATPGATGNEDTAIDISGAFTALLVDTDGSETITLLELSNIPVGHTVSDGTNNFTATGGSQTVDISGWTLASLTYQALANINGTFTIGVRAQTTDDDGFSATTDTAETTDMFDVVINPVNDDPVAADDGPIAITGGTVLNVDLRATDGTAGTAADSDIDGDVLTVTQIIDPSDGAVYTLTDSTPIQLTTNTTIERLPDGTLNITTAVLGQGIERFDYIIDDGNGGTDQATVTLDRSQGGLVNVPASVSGTEDNNIPLGITIDPALTSGGSQLDLISTETGFRNASASAPPTDFTIPPRTSFVRITAMGGADNGFNSSAEEDRQTYTVMVDLADGTYSGQLLYVVANTTLDNDLYAFSDVALGAGSYSDPNLIGDIDDMRNELTMPVPEGPASRCLWV